MATKAQRVAERLRLAEQEAARGNVAAAAAYAQAAANIQGSGQARVQAVADQYAAAAAPPTQQGTPAGTSNNVTEYGQAPSVSIPAGGGQATYTPGDYEPEPGFTQWARDIGATGAPTAAPAGPSQEELNARRNAVDMLADRLAQWGISGLSGMLNDLVVEFGPESTSTIMARVRQTDQYKERFKGLLNLRSRGIMDIPDEGSYLALERDYRGVFREAGLRDYLGTPGSQAEYDAIARIVGDFSLSVNEVRDRVTDAQRVVAETPQEVRDSLQRFYGIDPSLLTQYVLDPENTTTEIQRRANAAIVGGYAERAGLEFGAGVSERIGEFLGGERDIRGTQIEPQLTEIADIQRSTQRLAEIEQGELSAETSALAALDLDREARQRVRTLQSRERARFAGRSGITTGSLSQGPSI